jgi:hypothetical protein
MTTTTITKISSNRNRLFPRAGSQIKVLAFGI